MTSPITSFKGIYAFLSNFHHSPLNVEGKLFPTAEHAFQAAKTNDEAEVDMIRRASTPSMAKRLGRQVPLRADWESSKITVMHHIVQLKFRQHPNLANLLIATGNTKLIEGNDWHDNFWGDCSCQRCANIPGYNQLGHILMEVRQELLTHPPIQDVLTVLQALILGLEVPIMGYRCLLATEKETGKRKLAIIAHNETRDEETLLPLDLSLADFLAECQGMSPQTVAMLAADMALNKARLHGRCSSK